MSGQLGRLFFPSSKSSRCSSPRSEVTGLSTGFRDLDRKLTGLHPANLVIIAARPGDGEVALTANIAMNVALAGKPVAIFSLEMSKEEVAQRMLCSLARIDSMKLRTGKIGDAAWPRLTDAAGKLYDAPVFVDDSPVVTVTDIRAKCRRLKRSARSRAGGGRLHAAHAGVGSKENRQQEIAEISRSLKNLARELEVPIIAVSASSTETSSQREDKRPASVTCASRVRSNRTPTS
jgi:replicative DNA helicase